MGRFLNKQLEGLKPYAPGEQPSGITQYIKLNTNENPFPPPQKVYDVLRNPISAELLKRYPDPESKPLIRSLSETFSVGAENVMVGNGSDEILSFLFQGFCGGGVVINDITYGFYRVFCDMFSLSVKVVPLETDFTIDVEKYRGERGTVVLANPNAPTGIALPLDKIERILTQDSERLVVIDEAYVDFGGESAARLIGQYENLVVVQTMSKSRFLAGGRVGFALADKGIIADLNRLKYSFNPYNVNRLSMAAATAVLAEAEYFDACRFAIIRNREYLVQELTALGFFVLPSSANFIFAKPPLGLSAEEYYRRLKERQILVRYFSGERVNAFVRISIGSMEELQTLVQVTKIIL